MRNSIILALTPIALMPVAALPTPAVAAHALSGTWSKSSIKQHCDAAGGVFGTGDKGGYRCTAAGGGVSCDNNGKCIGTDPARLGGGKKVGGPVTVGGSKQSQQGGPKAKGGLGNVPTTGNK